MLHTLMLALIRLPLPILQQTWTTSEATVNTLTRTLDTTVETAPRMNINAGQTAALYLMLFNGAGLDLCHRGGLHGDDQGGAIPNCVVLR